MQSHTSSHSSRNNPCFCLDSWIATIAKKKNEIWPHPPFNSSARLQLQDLILTSSPEALTGSLQTHSKDSVLALDAGLNQGLTGASWLCFSVCRVRVCVCVGRVHTDGIPTVGITRSSAWVKAGSRSRSQSLRGSGTHPSLLLWQPF